MNLSDTLQILIDADIQCFLAACIGETKTDWGPYTDEQGILHETNIVIAYDLPKALSVFEAKVSNVIQAVREYMGVDMEYKVTMCLTHRNNFRKTLMPSYKANRTAPKPKLLPDIRAHCEAKYDCECWENLEADDTLSILGTTLDNSVVCSIDKDMLTIRDTIVYNWNKDNFVHTDPQSAQYHHYYQTLKGDSCDGFGGAKGIGDKRARAILETDDSWEAVESTFISKGQTKEDALLMARMAKLLTPDLYDRAMGTVTYWNPPGTPMPTMLPEVS